MDSTPQPGWFVRTIRFIFRTFLLTLLFAMLGMGVGLFLGIIITLIGAGIHHTSPDMTMAYRHFAVPVAIISGGGMLLYILISSTFGVIFKNGRE